MPQGDMMATTRPDEPIVYAAFELPPRRKLPAHAALAWLHSGRHYFEQAPMISLLYGSAFAAVGLAITLLGLNAPQFILTFWTGFLLVGPLLAMGLYRIAQLQDRGEIIRLRTCWGLLRNRLGAVALFALLLSLIMVAWIRFSTLIAALYIGNVSGMASFFSALATPQGLGFVAVLFATGALFATVMFALTTWSLPMVLDGHADFGTAVAASVGATLEQPIPMLLWGGSVAGLTLFGMLTLFVGFIVLFPLLGYATWAGYRDLFGRD